MAVQLVSTASMNLKSYHNKKHIKIRIDLRRYCTSITGRGLISPKGWSIDLRYISETIPDVLAVPGLILDDPWTFIPMSDEDRIALHSKIQGNQSTHLDWL